MGLFSLDIEKFYEELEEKGEQLKGIFCIQYPIYCIHSNITDITSDPLDNLDQAIIDFLISKPNFSAFQIGCLMGTSKSLIENRINTLKRDNLIELKDKSYILTTLGIEVFKEKTQYRQHKQSYDFYIDGLTFNPLPKVFYTNYKSKFISENDSYIRTNSNGETYRVRPFGPDLVHTPPNEEKIIDSILKIEKTDRELYSIPNGLLEINETSFTKLSLQLLVYVSSTEGGLIKKIIDGFAVYSLSQDISYYETTRKNVRFFEENIQEKINDMVFKITIPRSKDDKKEQPLPILTSNWHEIDKYKDSKNKCFSFSSVDLLRVIEKIFLINHVVEENLINSDDQVIISIDKKMLLESPNRYKIINDLIRKRDYKFGYSDNNVFLMYIYYNTSDEFVERVVNFRNIIEKNKLNNQICMPWLDKFYNEYISDYRQLLIASGDFELLEKLDIEKYMMKI